MLPFDQLSWRDFERLCLWLVEREGYERAEHLGAAGSEQGRDIIAWRGDELWAFQCKRVKQFGPAKAEEEIAKVLSLPQSERPTGLIFVVTSDISDQTRRRARELCALKMSCGFWAGTELDMKVSQYPDIVSTFFGLITTLDALRLVYPESGPAFEQIAGVLRELIRSHDTLQEWKELHHQLQTFFVYFRPFMTEVELAYNTDELWDAKRAKRLWRPYQTQVEELKSLARRIQHITTQDFEEDASGLRGASWVVDIVHDGYTVEALLDGQNLEELYEATNRLFVNCDRHLRAVDSEIRHAADGIAATLHKTLGSIGR
jgi:hypothetical protein